MKKIFLFLTALVAAFTLSAAPVELSRRAAMSRENLPVLGAKVGEQPAGMRNLSRASSGPAMLYRPLRAVNYSAAPAFVQPLSGELYGAVGYDDSSYSFTPGLFKIPLNANTGLEHIFDCGMIDIGTFVADGKMYVPLCDMMTGNVYGMSVYSMPSGEFESNVSVSCSYKWGTATWVPSMKAAIVFGISASKNALLKVTTDGSVTELASFSTSFELLGGLASSADGKLFGLAKDGKLYAINTQTFNTSLVGSTGIEGTYASSMAYDDENGLIHTVNSPEGNSTLYSINPATAAAEARYNFSSSLQVCYMYIGDNLAEKGAPAAVSDLRAIFEGTSLSGKVSFTAPATTYDGSAASGTITYTVTSAGRQLATGSTSFGAGTVEVPVTLSAAGAYTLEVYCSNAVGDGPVAEVSGYAGPDSPMAVENVTARYDNGRLLLSWNIPRGVNGGYVDPAQVSYEITRYVNGEPTVLPAVSGVTEFSEPWTEPADSFQSIFYSVKCVWNGTATLATPSNTVMLGCVIPPYEVPLSKSADARSLLVINNNHDSATWTYGETGGKASMRYNWSDVNKADDYLVLPGARLEKGKAYFFSFVAGVEGSNYPESYEVVVGRTPTAEGLSTVIKAETTINIVYGLNEKGELVGQRENVMFIPEADGIYYFAVKATSAANSYRLYVSDMAISAGVATSAPAAVSNLKLTPDPKGAESVTIEFSAPMLDISNAVLSGLDKVVIYRGDKEIVSLTPAIGAKVSYKDENAGSGNVSYTVVPVNAGGEGVPVRATVFVGVNAPAAPAEVFVTKGADYGEALVSWTPVTEDINGVPLTEVTYAVLRYNGSQWEVVSPDITETSYAVRACDAADAQAFAQFAVIATNKAGSGPGKAADPSPVGAPYTMPYVESFQMNKILGIMSSADDIQWMILKDSDIQGLSSQDGDNAYAGCSAQTPGSVSRVFTGRISIPADAENPAFAYHYFCQSANDANYFQLYVNDGSGKFEPVGDRKVLGQGTPETWNRVVTSLDAYKGKDVQIAIDLNIVNGGYGSEFIDNLSIRSMVDNDLSISLTLPETAKAGETVTLSATVLNGGLNAEPAYGVDFVVDDRVVATINGSALASGETKTYSYDYAVGKLAAAELKITARVNCGKDNVWGNNAETVMLPVELPMTPWVTDLQGAANDAGGVDLSWNEPDTAGAGEPVTDSFEEMDSFATMEQGDLAGWTFLDRDNQLVGSFDGLDIPNITPPCTASFFVSDDTYTAYQNSTSFAARSGHKYLAALFNYNLNEANDDWAVSPELAGCAQTITFYARAYHPEYPETIEVLYSTTDTNPDSFKAVTRFENLSTSVDSRGQFSWNKCSFAVPEGAKYFAIRLVSLGAFMVMVDDATYIPAGADPLIVEGYNVYRDGVKLNDSLITDTTFTDPEHVDNAAYVVTAVYSHGESRASNVVYPNGNSVGTIVGMPLVKGLRGEIEVSGTASQVTVTDMQGRVLYSGQAGRIPAAPGAYVVRVDRRAVKVLVK